MSNRFLFSCNRLLRQQISSVLQHASSKILAMSYDCRSWKQGGSWWYFLSLVVFVATTLFNFNFGMTPFFYLFIEYLIQLLQIQQMNNTKKTTPTKYNSVNCNKTAWVVIKYYFVDETTFQPTSCSSQWPIPFIMVVRLPPESPDLLKSNPNL